MTFSTLTFIYHSSANTYPARGILAVYAKELKNIPLILRLLCHELTV